MPATTGTPPLYILEYTDEFGLQNRQTLRTQDRAYAEFTARGYRQGYHQARIVEVPNPSHGAR